MTYTPKPGDRVTSPLLVGEWVVTYVYPDGSRARVSLSADVFGCVYTADMTPVAPPLPPEPAVGEVVWARGRYWARCERGWSFVAGSGEWIHGTDWQGLAADVEPVVRVSQVADWLEHNSCCGEEQVRDFHAEFGWDDLEREHPGASTNGDTP